MNTLCFGVLKKLSLIPIILILSKGLTHKDSKIYYFCSIIDRVDMDIRVGNGYDVHQLADGLRLVIGGVEIEHSKGCVAHSDGDVAIHALCDAILGALALGDIGKHFPDTSSEFKGIDSKLLLKRVMELVWERGYTLGNADITIAAQKPKMAPHIIKMREVLSDIMKVDLDRVSVKATTTEKLGFVGREEGIEVWASVIVLKK